MKIREDHSEKVWGQPEKVWAEPERNWGEPERVHWGDTLKVPAVKAWGKQEEEEEKAQNDQGTPRIYEIPPDDLDETQQGKFYELGEDEEAEPQELNLKESEVKAKVEEAQLASRSWELPELNTPVDHSLEMMSESVQVPQTHPNSANPNARPRSAAGDGKAIDTENQNPDDNAEAEGERPGKKFGYVLDSSDVRKYRVEERTPDGYIVGEYGVINHDNGFLRGVRYTADGTINPRLIHEALMKFLAL
jgi:pyruvate/2-oxoglutarate dehydrogenase complex dihydrolipoamide acyltransferase (E2) component